VSMVLQQTKTTSILKHVVIVGDNSSRLSVLKFVPPISLPDMLLVDGGRGGFEYLIYSCFPCDLPSLVVSFFAWTWVLHFCTLFSHHPLFWVLSFIEDWQAFMN